MKRVGIEFDSMMYNGDPRDVVLSASAVAETINYIVNNHNLSKLVVVSERLRKPLQKGKMKQWFKDQLTSWVKDGDNVLIALDNDPILAGLYAITNTHRLVLESQEKSLEDWADRLINNIAWPIMACNLDTTYSNSSNLIVV